MPIAVVSGANRGLGLEWTRQLLDKGWKVHAGFRSELGELKELEDACHHQLDVSSQESISSFVEKIGDRVDLLINNAGIAHERWQSVSEINFVETMKVIDINSLGPIRMTAALLPKMGGKIMSTVAMITSLMGSVGDCASGKSYAYRASKSALNMFSIAMKNELRSSNISIILLHPGWVKTDMGGPNALITPRESTCEMIKRVEEQTLDMTGRFIQYDGKALPW